MALAPVVRNPFDQQPGETTSEWIKRTRAQSGSSAFDVPLGQAQSYIQPGSPAEAFANAKVAPQGFKEADMGYGIRNFLTRGADFLGSGIPETAAAFDPTKLFPGLPDKGLVGAPLAAVGNFITGSPEKRAAAAAAAAPQAPAPAAPQQQPNVFGGGVERAGKKEGLANIANIAPSTGRAAPTGAQVFDVDNFMQNVARSESGGNPNAQNPGKGQSASGLFQFTDKTWRNVYKQINPKSGLSAAQITALKTDPDTQQAVMRQATNGNVNWLKSVGVPVTNTTAGIAHFLGVGNGSDAAKYFRALRDNPDTPLQNVISDAAYKANPQRMQGLTVGQFAQNEAKYWNGPDKTPAEQLGLTPYDTSFGQEALGMVDKATGQAKQPVAYDEAYVPTEDVPKPELAPKMDWTKSDAALADMRPEEITEAQKQHMRNTGMWKAAATALMNMPEGAGLGKVLASVGGGLMAGKMTGNEEIDAKMERFQDKMAVYKGQILRQETAKAEKTAQELGDDTRQMNAWQLKQYAKRVADVSRTSGAEVGPQGTTFRRLSKDGKTIEHRYIPNTGALDAEGTLKKAGIIMQIGQGVNSVEQSNNRYALGAFTKGLTQADPETLMQSPPAVASILYDNNDIDQVLPPEKQKALDGILQEQAAASGNPALSMPNSPEYKLARKNLYTEAMTVALHNNELADGGRQAQNTARQRFQQRRVEDLIDTQQNPTRKDFSRPGFFSNAAGLMQDEEE